MSASPRSSGKLQVACPRFEGRSQLIADLAGHPSLAFVVCEDEDATLAALADCEVLVLGGSHYTERIARRVNAGSQRLRWIQFASAGVDNAARFGVPDHVLVTNAAAAIAPTVAEHAMALMLAGLRQVVAIDRRRNEVIQRECFIPHLASLEGKTLLIVGYGNIGRELARRAEAFGPRIVVATRHPESVVSASIERHPLSALPELAADADIVVLAIALTRDTRGLIDAALLARMRPTAWLVNIARGGLVDEDSLVEALRSGRLAGAALDVTIAEPLPANHPLRTLDNVVTTPHIAGFGSEAACHRVAAIVGSNLRRYADGEPLLHRVDRAMLAAIQ